ncbi:hypothetical protein [Salinigranum halophilum]|uniref:hypothetical protein n=1 Tax=Salinigranum halophilum TaxID=2565931 RepID=UPI001376424B|nr:hypothetical protein [Salinigranum halophilum]
MSRGEERDTAGPPRRWVESFYDSETEVRSVLDDLREEHLLGEYGTVRNRLRAFAEAEDGIFRIVAFTLLDIETFYEDLESQYGEDQSAPTDDLRALGAEYDRLSDEFELVFAERTHELQNPMPVLRRGFRYSEGLSLPRLDYDLYSGNVKLCQFIHPPSQALMLARGVVASTCDLLERVAENNDDISETERERLAMVYENLEEELSRMEVYVDRGDEESLTDVDSSEEVEAYHDWSFY